MHKHGIASRVSTANNYLVLGCLGYIPWLNSTDVSLHVDVK